MNSTLMEAVVVKEALRWAKEMEGYAATIESDCLVVVQLIKSVAPIRSRLRKGIEECFVRGLRNAET